jgi:hypothetical protein
MTVHSPLRIAADALYDDGALMVAGFSSVGLRRARRSGRLRFAKQGNRIVYLGRWLLDWLESEGESGGGKGVPK